MRYIETYQEGDAVNGIYLCKSKGQFVAKNGKPYDNLTLADKTGAINGKVWSPNDAAIEEYSEGDYIDVSGDVVSFAGALQVRISRVRVAGPDEVQIADYMPASEKDIAQMYGELTSLIDSIANPHLKKLLQSFYIDDEVFVKSFLAHSAAKTMHHSFVGGLVEHTLAVAKLCDALAGLYPQINRDLLLTGALCHDIGKTRELSEFPTNEYTDEGQLIGHIVTGTEMIHDRIRELGDFPKVLEDELKHLILSHHGELEFGSPKKPAMLEALALNMADNTDAKLEMFLEALKEKGKKEGSAWFAYSKVFESNLRKTDVPE